MKETNKALGIAIERERRQQRFDSLAIASAVVAASLAIYGESAGLGREFMPLAALVLSILSAVFGHCASASRPALRAAKRLVVLSVATDTPLTSRQRALVAESLGLPSFTGTKDALNYYEHVTPPGPLRVRELYAYSAHFSKRIAHAQGRASLVFGFAVVTFSVWILYELVGSFNQAVAGVPPSPSLAANAVLVLLLSFVSVRSIRNGITLLQSSRLYERTRDSLIDGGSQDEVSATCLLYELDRVAVPHLSNMIYGFLRSSLEKEWRAMRGAIA